MNKTLYGYAPNVNGLLNPGRSYTHVHNIDAKRCRVDNDKYHFHVALPLRSYWCKAHERTSMLMDF